MDFKDFFVLGNPINVIFSQWTEGLNAKMY